MEYVQSYCAHHHGVAAVSQRALVDWLFDEVDRFRGIPGFYW